MSGRRVAILQSSYIPWRGYFTIMKWCDVFVVLDSVQFTRRDWRSRNRIRTGRGPVWLTVPLQQRGQYLSPIDAMVVAEPGWWTGHLGQIEAAYRPAPFGPAVLGELKEAYAAAASSPRLTDINTGLAAWICDRLAIRTPVVRDVDLLPRAELAALDATERLVALTRAAGGTSYLSGPAAREYLETGRFARHGIAVEWMEYVGLLPYPQHGGGWEPQISILDAFLNIGFEATRLSLPEAPARPVAGG